MSKILELKDIKHAYRQGSHTVSVLDGASLSLKPGETVALLGPSGSGKSTLLHLAGLLERPKAGEVYIKGRKTRNLSDDEKTRIRNQELGFIFQFHHLLPEFTALENVAFPLLIAGQSRAKALEAAQVLLKDVGLASRLEHRPSELSGGEQQRVAVARALVHGPSLLLADEPTGNLDPQTAGQVFAMIKDLARARKTGILIVTHDQALAKKADRRLRLEEGKIV